MKMNKKMILSILTLSILTISVLNCVAITETWACSQENIISRCGWIKGSILLIVNGQYAYHNYGVTATVPGVESTNVIPTPKGGNGVALDVKIKIITIQNKGSVKGSIYVQFVPVCTSYTNSGKRT